MNKKEAITILIKHSFIFNDYQKEMLVNKIDILSSEDIDNLGKFLVMEKKILVEKGDEIVSKLKKLEKELKVIGNSTQ